jgi:regulatory protein
MLVTKISVQVKNTDRVNIFVDGKYELSLSMDQLLEQKLKSNTEISQQDLKKLRKLSADGKLRARALEWVLSRPHSNKELSDYLKRKGADSSFIEKTVEEFNFKGYQNDANFAKWWVENRQRKNKSNREITLELRQKGVSLEVIDLVMADINDQKQRLADLIKSKKLLIKYPDNQKLIKYLMSKGYSYSDIAEVLAEFKEAGENF